MSKYSGQLKNRPLSQHQHPNWCILNLFKRIKHMDSFDDIQIEESVGFDFAEQSYDRLFDEEENESKTSKTFDSFLNSNYDY